MATSEQSLKQNAVGWFEIPVTNMDRAQAFYERVLGVKLERHSMGPLEMAWFLMVPEAFGAAGSLMKADQYVPSDAGTVVYFTAPSGDLATELSRVESSGGSVIVPKRKISDEYGYIWR